MREKERQDGMAGLLAADYNLQAISGATPASSLIALRVLVYCINYTL